MMGQMQTLNTMGLGEARNDVWLGFLLSAVAVAHTVAVCGDEVIQLGLSCVLHICRPFSPLLVKQCWQW